MASPALDQRLLYGLEQTILAMGQQLTQWRLTDYIVCDVPRSRRAVVSNDNSPSIKLAAFVQEAADTNMMLDSAIARSRAT